LKHFDAFTAPGEVLADIGDLNLGRGLGFYRRAVYAASIGT
jgi:hypothetical protein